MKYPLLLSWNWNLYLWTLTKFTVSSSAIKEHYSNNTEGYFYKCPLYAQLRLLCNRQGTESVSAD